MTSPTAPNQLLPPSKQLWRKVARNTIIDPARRWRAGVPNPDHLVAVPNGLRGGNAAKARDIYFGRFEFSGQSPDQNTTIPFQSKAPSSFWEAELHGFRWLRHLDAANTALAQANAQTLVSDWMALMCDQRKGVAWHLEVTANRVISWITHSPVIVGGGNREFYRVFIQNISDQVVWLSTSSRSMPDNMALLKVRIAIALASICLAERDRKAPSKHIAQTGQHLGRELQKQFLADGMHISRNPDNCLEAMLDLLPLIQVYSQLAVQPPVELGNAVDRIMPMLQFFRHRDGVIGQFNGGGVLNKSLLEAVFKAAPASGQPPDNAAPSGYQRLRAGLTTILMDTGDTEPSNAHAGCLAFEMSSHSSRFVINCGTPANPQSPHHIYAQSTAAHSTVTLNDTSSSRIQALEMPGFNKVVSERSHSGDGERVFASQEGYLDSFGLVHEREIFLGSDGKTINGTDRFIAPVKSGEKITNNNAAIRFHLHPSIKAQILENGISVQLTDRQDVSWKFTCIDAALHLDDSIHFAGATEKTRQIVLSAKIEPPSEIRWVFELISPAGKPRRQIHGNELLDMLATNNQE